jgi:hypothetical protein
MFLRIGKLLSSSDSFSDHLPEMASTADIKPSIVQLSFHSSLEKFKIWDLRFYSYVSHHKSDLLSLLSVSPDVKPDEKSAYAFSALLIPFLADDVVAHFTMQLDLKREGHRLYQLLHKRFSGETAEPEPSSEELMLKALRRRRDEFPTISDFLRDVQASLQRIERAGAIPFAERMLIAFSLQQLRAGSAFPWAASLAAKYSPLLRSDAVRKAPQSQFKDLTLDVFVKEACGLASAGLDSQPPSRPRCTNCNRFGHVSANCRQAANKSLGKPQQQHSSKGVRINALSTFGPDGSTYSPSPEPAADRQSPDFASDRPSSDSDEDAGDTEEGGMIYAVASTSLVPPDIRAHAGDVLVDTGAQQHMFNDRSLFVDYKPLTGRKQFVYTANGSMAPVCGIGTVRIPVPAFTSTEYGLAATTEQRFVIELHRVLYVPTLAMNIFAAGRWARRADRAIVLDKRRPRLVHGDVHIPLHMPSTGTLLWLSPQRV